MSDAFDFDCITKCLVAVSGKVSFKDCKIKVNGGGQECPPYHF